MSCPGPFEVTTVLCRMRNIRDFLRRTYRPRQMLCGMFPASSLFEHWFYFQHGFGRSEFNEADDSNIVSFEDIFRQRIYRVVDVRHQVEVAIKLVEAVLQCNGTHCLVCDMLLRALQSTPWR